MGLKQDLIDAKVKAAKDNGFSITETGPGSFIEREAEYTKEAKRQSASYKKTGKWDAPKTAMKSSKPSSYSTSTAVKTNKNKQK